jgi:hypothetical protein
MKVAIAVIKHLLKSRNIDHLQKDHSIVVRAEDKDKILDLVKEVVQRNKNELLIVENYILEGLVIITLK